MMSNVPSVQGVSKEDPINDSPLWRISIEKRKEMLEKSDLQIFDFILMALQDYQRRNAKLDEITDPDAYGTAQNLEALYYAALQTAVVRYSPEAATDGGFRAYVGTIFYNKKKEYYGRQARELAGTQKVLSKQDKKIIKKLIEFAEDFEVDEAALLNNARLKQAAADAFEIPVKKVERLLHARQMMVRLDDQESDAVQASAGKAIQQDTGIEQMVERKMTREAIENIAQMMALLTLREKEKHGKHHGLCWSTILLEYLRGNEKYRGNNRKKDASGAVITKAKPLGLPENERLANCEFLAPLEQAGCLWDVLLMTDYVAYVIAPPLPERELVPVALNPLANPNNPPGQKTVAIYLGISESGVAQQMQKFDAYYEKLCKEMTRAITKPQE